MDWKLINHQEVLAWLLGVIAVIVLISDFIHVSMSELESIRWWIELIAIAISVPLLVMWWMSISLEHKLHFAIIEKVREPPDNDWHHILVHSPNRLAKQCKIWLNNTPLPWLDNNGLYYRDINLGGGGNALIPRDEFPDDILWKAEVKVMEEKKTRETFRFSKLKDMS